MTIEIERLERPFVRAWNDLLERAPRRSPFHRAEALSVMADHSGQTLHPLVGYKGDEPVGLFPLFTMERGPLTAGFSPPPNLKVTYLGPILADVSALSSNKAERRRRRFVDAALSWLDDAHSPRYVHVRTAPEYCDPRPFEWGGFEATPRFTYRVDLSAGPEELFERFSRDVRTNVRDASERCETSVGDEESVRTITRQVRSRYAEQDVAFHVTDSFVVDLYEALPAGWFRPLVCEVDGAFAGGSLVLEDGESVYGWLGSVASTTDADVNDLLHWRVIQDAADRDMRTYDLVGANDARLSRFKSKFAPTLATYHELTRAGPGTALAERLYQRVLST